MGRFIGWDDVVSRYSVARSASAGAKDMDEQDIDLLREQVDLALADPDFSIITNFEINWEEMGPNDRLLDLQGEYDLWSRKMYAGLGVTESLLSGEASYSSERISLEVINVRYMHLRMMLKDFVEKFLFRPMCWRLGNCCARGPCPPIGWCPCLARWQRPRVCCAFLSGWISRRCQGKRPTAPASAGYPARCRPGKRAVSCGAGICKSP